MDSRTMATVGVSGMFTSTNISPILTPFMCKNVRTDVFNF
jgi:hypothetical protein